MAIEYVQPTDKWWDNRCLKFGGKMQAVMDGGMKAVDCFVETSHQVEWLLKLPAKARLPWRWNEWHMQYHSDNKTPYRVDKIATCDKTVLDVGCGVARLTSRLAEMADKVCGLDWSQEMLRLAGRSYPELYWVLGDAATTRLFEAGQFGVVFAWNCLSHNTDDEKWRNIVRNLSY